MAVPGATILGVEGLELGRDEAAFLRDADPFGLILFARNVDTPAQVRRLTADLRAALGREAPILIDQEGGRVQRLRAPHWREWLPPLDQMARSRPGADARGIWIRYRMIAAELHALGIDADCAPSCDIAWPETHPFLKNRCFGFDAAAAARAARAAAEGLLAGGVLPVMKHIPGHGRTLVDSHHHLPVAPAPVAELVETDFAPFRALNDLPMGMTAHIVVPACDAAKISAITRGQITDGSSLFCNSTAGAPYNGIRTGASITTWQFADGVHHMLGLYDWQITTAQLNVMDTHDTPRMLHTLQGDESAVRLCTLFQMTMPGAPCVYYGDEVGLTGGMDPGGQRRITALRRQRQQVGGVGGARRRRLAEVAQAGFDPVYGARPLKRAIQQQIENPLSRKILEGAVGPKETIKVEARGGGLVFEIAH